MFLHHTTNKYDNILGMMKGDKLTVVATLVCAVWLRECYGQVRDCDEGTASGHSGLFRICRSLSYLSPHGGRSEYIYKNVACRLCVRGIVELFFCWCFFVSLFPLHLLEQTSCLLTIPPL